jgi:hypothetical protein
MSQYKDKVVLVQLHAQAALAPGKESPVPNGWVDWVGSRAGADVTEKTFFPYTKSNLKSSAVHLVAYLLYLPKYPAISKSISVSQNTQCVCITRVQILNIKAAPVCRITEP